MGLRIEMYDHHETGPSAVGQRAEQNLQRLSIAFHLHGCDGSIPIS
jgi:hypothetical protein